MKLSTFHWLFSAVAPALVAGLLSQGCSDSPVSDLGSEAGASVDDCVAQWTQRPDLLPSNTPQQQQANESFLAESFELCDYTRGSVECSFRRAEATRIESLYVCETSDGASHNFWVPTNPEPRFNIAFDYRFDKLGFFDVPERKRALEHSARIWEEVILSEFPSVPSGTVLQIPDPSVTRDVDVVDKLVNVSVPEIDDILVFVASVVDDKTALASAMRNRYGTDFDAITDEELRQQLRSRWEGFPSQPWAGAIAFNHRALDSGNESTWSFDTGLIGPVEEDRREYDFATAATHELMHVLGIHSRSPVFARKIVEYTDNIVFVTDNGVIEVPTVLGFDGHQSVCEFTKYLESGFKTNVLNKEDITLPLDSQGTHTNEALVEIPRFYALIDPYYSWPSLSSNPGRLDYALLKDIGYRLSTPDCL